jgi:hypothetical protein
MFYKPFNSFFMAELLICTHLPDFFSFYLRRNEIVYLLRDRLVIIEALKTQC